MGDIVAIDNKNALTAMSESELVDVLQSSLYPGAALKSIKMVIGYCKAANLDPMQKPVHIVPMWDKNAKAMRDVIMPGVGLYRTQAARSNALAGISEPEFGPVIEFDLGGSKFRAPEWCRVVVKRLLANGSIAEFAAVEYWIENYATAGKDSSAPNAMWKKRPRGQLGKCAQAQALRTAFPEMTGSAPTADEMEGKHIDQSEIDITPKSEPVAKKPEFYSDDKFNSNRAAWENIVATGRKTTSELIVFIEARALLTASQKKEISGWKKAEPMPEQAAENPPIATQSMDDFNAGLDGGYTPE